MNTYKYETIVYDNIKIEIDAENEEEAQEILKHTVKHLGLFKKKT